MEGAMGDGWDFCSAKKKDILTTHQGWVKLTHKDSGETLQIQSPLDISHFLVCQFGRAVN